MGHFPSFSLGGGKIECHIKRFEGTRFYLLQSNGLALKQGENCFHSLNVKQIKAPEHKKRSYDRTLKGIHKQHINKRRRKKENRRKLNERKRKLTENSV